MYRFAGLGDALDNTIGPLRFNADNDHRRHIRVTAGADQGAEMQFEILAELKPAIGMGNGQGSLDVIGNRFTGGIGKVVQGKDDDVVANPDPAVFAAISIKLFVHCYHLLVLTL